MDKKLLLLGLLRRQEMYGYQLNEMLAATLSTCVEIKRPTAYYVLNKMLEEGWIKDDEEQEGKRPPRRVYSVTPEGEAAFQRLLRENLSRYEPAQFGGDVGLAYHDELPVSEVLALLSQRREVMCQHLTATEAIPAHPGSLQLMIEHQRRHLLAELAWLDEVMERLREAREAN